ncbi:MAG TPA: methyltransferase domain-containing protein [Ktedonobacterales bacterium]|jgi:ubiquinone/menaquinone biosynthesis C-methylase UbiE
MIPEPNLPRVDFATVDSAPHPQQFVRYLENARGNAGIQALKRQSYTLLEAEAGKRLLDVGCGLGDDVRALAQIVGVTGAAVGIDNSRTMIETATRNSAGADFPGSFQQGDIHRLPFADASFDGCRAERVLIHSDDPAQALAEMARVVRPGGMVVVIEPDLETVIIHLSDPTLARKLTAWQCNSVRNGRVGRQLPGLFQQSGLTGIQMLPTVHYATRLESLEGTQRMLRRAEQQNALTAEEAQAILQELQRRNEQGQYFEFGVFFTLAGRKEPDRPA